MFYKSFFRGCRLKKYIICSFALVVMVTLLVGCQRDDGVVQPQGQSVTTSAPDNQQLSVGLPEDSIDFNLSREDSPEFTEGLDSVVSVEPMYVERDGYAYQLDPATLQPINQPLDPETYEPVDIVKEAPVEEEVAVVDSPSAEEPTESTKYPNTGIFLEDD